jgi:hypothetical protein
MVPLRDLLSDLANSFPVTMMPTSGSFAALTELIPSEARNPID